MLRECESSLVGHSQQGLIKVLEIIKLLGRGLVLEFLAIATDCYHGLVKALVWPRRVVWIAGPR